MDLKAPKEVANENLLVSWKDIAAYLKCSVRKAQRLERLQLPVHRLEGVKSVWASRVEIDAWMAASPVADRPLLSERRDRAVSHLGLALLIVFAALTIAAAWLSAYGLTIALFGVTTALLWFVYPSMPDNRLTRGIVALFIVAGMAYAAAATTLPEVVSNIVNMTTLKPAFVYPFVTGLRFVPVPVLIAVFLVLLREGGFAKKPRLRRVYLAAGTLLLVGATVSSFTASGIYALWKAHLPIFGTMLAGESFVLATNAVLLVLAYRFFNVTTITGSQWFFQRSGIAYLLIALTASILGRHGNELREYYLDSGNPRTYRVLNSNAIDASKAWLLNHSADAGPELEQLFDNPEFVDALRTQEFHRVPFDELYPSRKRAVIFGYKVDGSAIRRRPVFVLVRFPAELASQLRFETASD
jgi:hypothetical protein